LRADDSIARDQEGARRRHRRDDDLDRRDSRRRVERSDQAAAVGATRGLELASTSTSGAPTRPASASFSTPPSSSSPRATATTAPSACARSRTSPSSTCRTARCCACSLTGCSRPARSTPPCRSSSASSSSRRTSRSRIATSASRSPTPARRRQAVERLYTVVTGAWDARFADVDLIALGELNAVVDKARRAGRPVDVRAIDPRLLRNLPLDVRVVLAWDADNTDVDLHVIDANGEEVYYGHNASYQGGTITRDATGGYGPEEFALKVAKPGKYRVEANFFGHRQQVLTSGTGLMLWLSSGFGTAAQKDQRTTVRVRSERSERIVVGEFEVKAGASESWAGARIEPLR
jgi:hypothetical protein